MGMASTRTGGFDMAFRLFNFHVDNDGAAKLISISESTPPVADPSTPPAIGNYFDGNAVDAIRGRSKTGDISPISRVK
jgi:hypothetical protein